MAANAFSGLGAISSPSLHSISGGKPTLENPFFRTKFLQTPLLGNLNTLSLRSSCLKPQFPKRRPITATISLSLPTVKPDGVSSAQEVPKWSARAIRSFAMGELEARKLKYPKTGTEALLMGILVEGTSRAAKVLRESGVGILKVRDEIVKMLGRGEMYYFSPEHPPLTEDAQRAINWALDQKLKSGDNGEITATHILLGVWSEKDSPGHEIMATLGFDDEKAKNLMSLISEPGFVDK